MFPTFQKLLNYLFEGKLPELSPPGVAKTFGLLLVCLAEFLLIVLTVPLVFETNDDVAMNAIASGARSGEPLEFLIFTHLVIGKLLRLLYEWQPQINWYTYYLIASLWTGYAALQYAVASLKSTRIAAINRHLLLFLLVVFTLFIPHFTRVAAVCLAGGLMLVLFSRKNSWIQFTLGTVLILLGAAIRHQVLIMFVLLSIPIIAHLLHRKCYTRVLLLAIIFIAGGISTRYHLNSYAQHPDYGPYKHFNNLRSNITTTDTPHFNWEMQEVLIREVGWSKDDFEVAANFNLDPGPPSFEMEKIVYLNQHLRIGLLEKTFSKTAVAEFVNALNNFFSSLSQKRYWIFFALLLAWTYFKGKTLVRWFALYATYIFVIGYVLVMYGGGVLKPWVLYGLTLPLFILIVLLTDVTELANSLVDKHSTKLQQAVTALVTLGVLIPIWGHLRIYPTAIEERIVRDQQVYEFIQNQNEAFFVNWLELNHYPLFSLPYALEGAYHLGWTAGSPINQNLMERYTGTGQQSVYAIREQPVVWYFRLHPDQYWNFGEIVEAFYLHHYPEAKVTRENFLINEKDEVLRYTFVVPGT
ncbi:MAG: hypothetical protein EA392_11510 [Cryomorphaceae bacterium]|nr:MAG: hypothetical protein EA392_11510 [Cryomorphaceae bacterium]